MSDCHLFVIPTDRPCASSLESYASEIEKLAQRREVYVLLLEDRALPPDVSDDHVDALGRVLERVGCPGKVFTQRDWRMLVEGVEWPGFAGHLIEDQAISYGRAFNKTALVAAALGAKVVHRRDSDTFSPEQCQEWDAYPADFEVDVLESSDCDVVGGNYWGNWNVALGPLGEDEERLRLMLSAHDIPVIGQESIVNDQIPGAERPPMRERGQVTYGAYPDLGNCAFRTDAAVEYPAPLAPEMIGTDYLFLNFAVGQGKAWLHGMSVGHRHASHRQTPAYLHDYWLRRARQMDFLLVLHELEDKLPPVHSYEEQREALGAALEDLPSVFDRCDPKRRVYWAAYVEVFQGSSLDREEGLADHLRRQRTAIQAENDAELLAYGELLRGWGALRSDLIERLSPLRASR